MSTLTTTEAPPSAPTDRPDYPTPATERDALELAFRALTDGPRTKTALNALARMIGRTLGKTDPAPTAPRVLTPREREVVALLAGGLTVKATAERLHTSPKTVDAQKTTAMKKLDIHNRAALTLWAVREGLVKA